jgi:hypothetical protein
VVRAFVRLREVLASNKHLARQIEALEKKFGKHDAEVESILGLLRQLVEPPLQPKRRIGFVSLDRRQIR